MKIRLTAAYVVAASRGFPYLGSDGEFRVIEGKEVFLNSFYRYPANIKCVDRLLVGFKREKVFIFKEDLSNV